MLLLACEKPGSYNFGHDTGITTNQGGTHSHSYRINGVDD